MKRRAVLALVLVATLAGCGVIPSASRGSDSVPASGAAAAARPNDIYAVLLRALRMNALPLPVTQLQFGQTREDAVLQVVNQELPVAPERVLTGLSTARRYRYVLAQYRGSYSMMYRFGYERGGLQPRLYLISLRVPMPGERRPELDNEAYWKLEELYGAPSRVEKAAADATSGQGTGLPGNNLYVWEAPRIIITYRSLYDETQQENTTIVEYWDAGYYLRRNGPNP